MAKLIRIFAASIGGGLALGAAIRIGSAVSQKARPAGPVPARRLDSLDARLRKVEEAQVDRAELTETVAQLRLETELGQKAMLDAVVDGVQTRVAQRMSKIEEDVANHASAMAELRDCSLRTEQSLQKLLAGLDRLVAVQLRPEPARPADMHDKADSESDEGHSATVPIRVVRR